MSAGLRQSAADYLAVRRALGYQLARPEKLLGQFISYLEQAGAATVTTCCRTFRMSAGASLPVSVCIK